MLIVIEKNTEIRQRCLKNEPLCLYFYFLQLTSMKHPTIPTGEEPYDDSYDRQADLEIQREAHRQEREENDAQDRLTECY